MKKLYATVALCVLLLSTKAQNVNIPDAAFKTFLLAKDSINTNHDGEIQVAEAAAYTGSLMIVLNGGGTHDLTGIEAFVNLTKLECYTTVYSLNLSANTALTRISVQGCGLGGGLTLPHTTTLTDLDCSYNSIMSIDVSANTSLNTFHCNSNQLSTLNLNSNRSLHTLDCSSNQLIAINLFDDTALTDLNCASNLLQTLDVSYNLQLVSLACGNNLLPALDVSHNLQLASLGCDRNSLTALDLTANTDLGSLSCNSNHLTDLNLSVNHLLQNLSCDSNNLTGLNLLADTAMRTLSCADNQLTSLILPPNTNFVSVGCRSNKLENLDVSTSTYLLYLDCSHNLLTKLKAKVGPTKDFVQFSVFSNPNLNCIEVDSVDYFNALWSSTKDAWASYSANCSYSGINESGKANTSFTLYPNPATNSVTITLDESMVGSTATITDVTGRKVGDVLLSTVNRELSTENLANGLYLVTLTSLSGRQAGTGGSSSTKKLIITK